MVYLKVFFAALAAVMVKGLFSSIPVLSPPHVDVHGIGTYLEVLGGLYSIVVAFVIYVVWDQFSRVQMGLAQEAAALEDLYRVATFASNPEDVRGIRNAARQYLETAASDEPIKLARGETSGPAEERFHDLSRSVRGVEAATPKDGAIYGELLSALTRISDSRDGRLSVSGTRIPRTLWNLIVFASAALFCGFLALGIHSFWLGLGVAGAVAGTLTFLLLVIQDMDNPFEGVWKVSYSSMRNLAARLGQK